MTEPRNLEPSIFEDQRREAFQYRERLADALVEMVAERKLLNGKIAETRTLLRMAQKIARAFERIDAGKPIGGPDVEADAPVTKPAGIRPYPDVHGVLTYEGDDER